jgi:hypothetical protein
MTRERDIEKYLVQKVKALGGLPAWLAYAAVGAAALILILVFRKK